MSGNSVEIRSIIIIIIIITVGLPRVAISTRKKVTHAHLRACISPPLADAGGAGRGGAGKASDTESRGKLSRNEKEAEICSRSHLLPLLYRTPEERRRKDETLPWKTKVGSPLPPPPPPSSVVGVRV